MTNLMNITIRITRATITFTAPNTVIEGQTDFEQYNMKPGIAVAANLRQALAECRILKACAPPGKPLQPDAAAQYNPVFESAIVFVDTPLLLIPAEEYDEEAMPTLYHHVNTKHADDDVVGTAIPLLNVVAAYAVGKDLKFVLAETFRTVQFMPLLGPLLVEFCRHSYGGYQEKLFCYFHDKRIDVCAFRKGRVRLYSSFEVAQTPDAVYYILNVWQTLGMKPADILCLAGAITGHEALVKGLHRFIKNISNISI